MLHWMKVAVCAAIAWLPTLCATRGGLRDAATALHAEVDGVGEAVFTASDYKPGMVRHFVLLRFRDGVSEPQKRRVNAQFIALQTSCTRDGRPYIQSIETGLQISGEHGSHAFEQGVLMTFASQGDRNYYIGGPFIDEPGYYDPAHAAFKKVLAPLLAKNGLVVFDFQSPRHESPR